MDTSNSNKNESFTAKLENLKSWLVKNAKVVMPAVLAVCVVITVVISVSANRREEGQQEDIEANTVLADGEGTGDTVDAQETALKENDNPEIKALIEAYYAALADGDVDTIRTLVDVIDGADVMWIEELSKYLEAVPTLDIYTKPGPVDNSYMIYISLTEKFTDYDNPIPGLETKYVCADENGKYYICNSDNGDESEVEYMQYINLQEDVIDLNNKIAVEYNNMVAEDEELQKFLADLEAEINKNIGETLALATENDVEEDTDIEGTESTEPVTVVTKVKAIEVVNIRSSDSETADKLGKAAIGDEFKLIEKIENGWSKVEYEGKEAYIKSMYLEDIEFADAAPADTTETQTDDMTVTGTVTTTANVRIRSAASENSEKLGVAYEGQKLDVIMKQADGWTKIKYNGQIAYVKSDYVE